MRYLDRSTRQGRRKRGCRGAIDAPPPLQILAEIEGFFFQIARLLLDPLPRPPFSQYVLLLGIFVQKVFETNLKFKFQ